MLTQISIMIFHFTFITHTFLFAADCKIIKSSHDFDLNSSSSQNDSDSITGFYQKMQTAVNKCQVLTMNGGKLQDTSQTADFAIDIHKC